MKATDEHVKTSLNSAQPGGVARSPLVEYPARSTILSTPLDNLYGVDNFLFSSRNQLSGFRGSAENINARLFECFIRDAATPAKLTAPKSGTEPRSRKIKIPQANKCSASIIKDRCNTLLKLRAGHYKVDSLLTIEEAAAKLRVSVSTVRSWRYNRKLEFTRFGRRLYIDVGVVEKLLAENVIPALPASSHLNSRSPAGQGGAETKETEK